MIVVRQSLEFRHWFAQLRDRNARMRIQARIDRAVIGNIGDQRFVGDSVHEMRIDYGPGYRLYFTRRGADMIILLCGGDKHTQFQDIARARALAREV